MTTATLEPEGETTTEQPTSWAEWDLVLRLSREKKKAAALLSREEGRFLVDQYYALQKYRIAAAGRIRSMVGEPNDLMTWLFNNMAALERDLQSALGYWAKQWRVGVWLQSICGIGPVISAGLLAHLDVRHAPNASHFWSFAGLSNRPWNKSEKRPWNANLKTLVAFKLGESFVKVQNSKNDFYGQLFRQRKDLESTMNLDGKFKEQAAEKLEKYKIGKTTDAFKHYSTGQLPPAHIHARARRWVVKLFLAHLHEVMFIDFHGEKPPEPYSFSEKCPGAHRHKVDVPNWPVTKGRPLKELLSQDTRATSQVLRTPDA